MSNNSKTISDSTTFIDLRNEVIAELCEIEESIYNANGEIDSLERKINRLYSIALELENEYFILRLQTIQNQFRKFRSKKGYRQLEFDRLFKLLEKLKDTDTVDFLNSAIKNRIDRIAKGVANKKVFRKVEPSELRENKFIVYTFQKLFFVVKSFPKRILQKVPYRQKRIRFHEEPFDIFPFKPFEDKNEKNNVSNLLILRSGLDFKPLRFDSIESEIEIFPDELSKKCKPLKEETENVKKFIRWKGNNCYLIEFPEVF